MSKPLSPRLQHLQSEIQNLGIGALRIFWKEILGQGTPIIEPSHEGFSLVTFLWRDDGSARNVAVIQDWGADGIREHHMTHLTGSDVWFLTREMRSDTRTTYQLSPSSSIDPSEPAPYLLDPLNPKTFTAYLSETGKDILFSLLELPHAPALPWRHASSIRTGKIELHTPFADQRHLWVYMPAIETESPLPVLIVFDGRLYKDQLKLPKILDYLIDGGEIPSVAALLVDNADRNELLCRPEFADYIAIEVISWLRANYPISQDPSQTIVMGSSFGGLSAAFLSFKHPNIFGTVFSQTGWFRWHAEDDLEHHWLPRQFAAVPKLPLRFWL